MSSLRLVPYDAAWPARYEALEATLRTAIGDHALAIEHIGSTAVPGLMSKPVIDVAVAVVDEATADRCIVPLEALGFRYRGLNGDDPRRRYYVLDARDGRAVQLHLYILPSTAFTAILRFRDALRGDPVLREAYANEKLRIAAAVGWDKARYSVAKTPFVQSVLAGAPLDDAIAKPPPNGSTN